MRHSSLFFLAFLLCLPAVLHAESPARRSIAIEDIYRMQDVAEVTHLAGWTMDCLHGDGRRSGIR